MTNTEIENYLNSRIAEGDFPSAAYLVAKNGATRFKGAIGNAVVEPEPIAAVETTVYDLASLTKPLVTGLICGILLKNKQIGLNDPVCKYLPELNTPDKCAITIENLLTHTSGLQAWRPFYLFRSSAPAATNVLRQISDSALQFETGTKVLYSDLNFLTLGFVIEKICGKRLKQASEELLFKPLGLSVTCFQPAPEQKPSIAASEKGNEYEKQMCIDTFPEIEIDDSLFRKDVIHGEVHDGNCFYMGGAAGHAGLFSDLEETAQLAAQFLGGHSRLLSHEICTLFTKNFTLTLNQDRSLAFQIASTPDCSAGPDISPQSIGHLGFTGTSVWIDTSIDGIFVLLTNRTHHRKPPFADLSTVRRTFNSLAFNSLLN